MNKQLFFILFVSLLVCQISYAILEANISYFVKNYVLNITIAINSSSNGTVYIFAYKTNGTLEEFTPYTFSSGYSKLKRSITLNDIYNGTFLILINNSENETLSYNFTIPKYEVNICVKNTIGEILKDSSYQIQIIINKTLNYEKLYLTNATGCISKLVFVNTSVMVNTSTVPVILGGREFYGYDPASYIFVKSNSTIDILYKTLQRPKIIVTIDGYTYINPQTIYLYPGSSVKVYASFYDEQGNLITNNLSIYLNETLVNSTLSTNISAQIYSTSETIYLLKIVANPISDKYNFSSYTLILNYTNKWKVVPSNEIIINYLNNTITCSYISYYGWRNNTTYLLLEGIYNDTVCGNSFFSIIDKQNIKIIGNSAIICGSAWYTLSKDIYYYYIFVIKNSKNISFYNITFVATPKPISFGQSLKEYLLEITNGSNIFIQNCSFSKPENINADVAAIKLQVSKNITVNDSIFNNLDYVIIYELDDTIKNLEITNSVISNCVNFFEVESNNLKNIIIKNIKIEISSSNLFSYSTISVESKKYIPAFEEINITNVSVYINGQYFGKIIKVENQNVVIINNTLFNSEKVFKIIALNVSKILILNSNLTYCNEKIISGNVSNLIIDNSILNSSNPIIYNNLKYLSINDSKIEIHGYSLSLNLNNLIFAAIYNSTIKALTTTIYISYDNPFSLTSEIKIENSSIITKYGNAITIYSNIGEKKLRIIILNSKLYGEISAYSAIQFKTTASNTYLILNNVDIQHFENFIEIVGISIENGLEINISNSTIKYCSYGIVVSGISSQIEVPLSIYIFNSIIENISDTFYSISKISNKVSFSLTSERNRYYNVGRIFNISFIFVTSPSADIKLLKENYIKINNLGEIYNTNENTYIKLLYSNYSTINNGLVVKECKHINLINLSFQNIESNNSLLYFESSENVNIINLTLHDNNLLNNSPIVEFNFVNYSSINGIDITHITLGNITGIIKVKNSLNISISNIIANYSTYISEGFGKVLKYGIEISNTKNIKLSKIKLVGIGKEIREPNLADLVWIVPYPVKGIYILNSSNIIITNIYFKYVLGYGIILNTSTNISLYNLTILKNFVLHQDSVATKIYYNGGIEILNSSNIYGKNITIEDLLKNAIFISNSQNISFIDLTSKNNGLKRLVAKYSNGEKEFIFSPHINVLNTKNFYLSNCKFINGYISALDLTNSEFIHVNSSLFSNFTYYEIVCDNNNQVIIVNSNFSIANTVLYVNLTDNIEIINNIIQNVNAYGIYFSNSRNISILHNKLSNINIALSLYNCNIALINYNNISESKYGVYIVNSGNIEFFNSIIEKSYLALKIASLNDLIKIDNITLLNNDFAVDIQNPYYVKYIYQLAWKSVYAKYYSLKEGYIIFLNPFNSQYYANTLIVKDNFLIYPSLNIPIYAIYAYNITGLNISSSEFLHNSEFISIKYLTNIYITDSSFYDSYCTIYLGTVKEKARINNIKVNSTDYGLYIENYVREITISNSKFYNNSVKSIFINNADLFSLNNSIFEENNLSVEIQRSNINNINSVILNSNYYGIIINNANIVKINNITAKNNDYVIVLHNIYNSYIINNSNFITTEVTSINLLNCKNGKILNSEFYSNNNSIVIDQVINLLVNKCRFTENKIAIMGRNSSNIYIIANDFVQNQQDIYFYGTKATQKIVSSGQGSLFARYYVKNVNISHNIFNASIIAVHFKSGKNITIYDNSFNGNKYSILFEPFLVFSVTNKCSYEFYCTENYYENVYDINISNNLFIDNAYAIYVNLIQEDRDCDCCENVFECTIDKLPTNLSIINNSFISNDVYTIFFNNVYTSYVKFNDFEKNNNTIIYLEKVHVCEISYNKITNNTADVINGNLAYNLSVKANNISINFNVLHLNEVYNKFEFIKNYVKENNDTINIRFSECYLINISYNKVYDNKGTNVISINDNSNTNTIDIVSNEFINNSGIVDINGSSLAKLIVINNTIYDLQGYLKFLENNINVVNITNNIFNNISLGGLNVTSSNSISTLYLESNVINNSNDGINVKADNIRIIYVNYINISNVTNNGLTLEAIKSISLQVKNVMINYSTLGMKIIVPELSIGNISNCLVKNSNNNAAIFSLSNTTIYNCKFINTISRTDYSVIFKNSNNLTITNILVANNSGHGIDIINSNNITLEKSNIIFNGGWGIHIYFSSVYIYNCTISYNKDEGIRVEELYPYPQQKVIVNYSFICYNYQNTSKIDISNYDPSVNFFAVINSWFGGTYPDDPYKTFYVANQYMNAYPDHNYFCNFTRRGLLEEASTTSLAIKIKNILVPFKPTVKIYVITMYGADTGAIAMENVYNIMPVFNTPRIYGHGEFTIVVKDGKIYVL